MRPPPSPGPCLGLRVVLPALALLVVAIGAAMWWLADRQEQGQIQGSREEAARTHTILKVGLRQQMLRHVEEPAQAGLLDVHDQAGLSGIMLLDKQGRVHASSDPQLLGRQFPEDDARCAACHDNLQRPTQWMDTVQKSNGETVLRSMSLLLNDGGCRTCHTGDGSFLGVLAVDHSMTPALARMADTRRSLLWVAALTFTALLTAVYLIHRRLVVRPASAHAAVAKENERLYALTITDELTQLYTLRFFQQTLAREVENYHRYGQKLSLLMLDLDDFKRVNDENGHPAGDRFLQQLATVFRRCVRDVDVVCRYGGEEFAIILPETGPRSSAVVAERIRAAVEKALVETDGGTLRATVSIGYSSCPADATTVRDLVRLADRALYAAKEAGKNRVEPAARAA